MRKIANLHQSGGRTAPGLMGDFAAEGTGTSLRGFSRAVGGTETTRTGRGRGTVRGAWSPSGVRTR